MKTRTLGWQGSVWISALGISALIGGEFADEPYIIPGGHTEMHWDFQTFIRFKPSGSTQNIYVTLGRFSWHAYGATDLATIPGTTVQDYTPFPPLIPPFPEDPDYSCVPVSPGEARVDIFNEDSEIFPFWARRASIEP